MDKDTLICYYIVIRYIALRYNASRYSKGFLEISMAKPRSVHQHLPLTEATSYILLALFITQHGYAIMQDVEEMSEGAVKLGPGTLYGALTNLEDNKLIRKVDEVKRRKVYAITEHGKAVLMAQAGRHEVMLRNVHDRQKRINQ